MSNFVFHPLCPRVFLHKNDDGSAIVGYMSPPKTLVDQVVGTSLLGPRVFTRLTFETLDFVALTDLVDQLFAADPPAVTEDVLQGRSLAIELSEDGAHVTLAFMRSVTPKDLDEGGVLRYPTFGSELITDEVLVVKISVLWASVWLIRLHYTSELQQRVLTHIATTIR